jgi:hypothetical protein
MSSLRKDLRNELERTVVKARDIAEAAATAALQALAVDQPKPFPHMDADARALRNRLRERGRAAGDMRDAFSNTQPLGHLAQLVGYEHWHRMLFARFLAENGLLLEPEHQVALSLADVEELAREEGADLWQLAGSYAQRMLPEVFRNDDPALEVTLAREDRVKLEKLLADLDPATFTATDSLGWTYQFWQTKRKGEVNASGVKIGADEISPVTQLFTEDYMVDFLLDNTLGAWHAGKILAANPALAETARNEEELRNAVALPSCPWSYLRFIQGEDGKWTPAAGTFDGWPKTAAELKCLDPCCGSGHFLVAMFERLVALVMAETKQDEASAVKAVIRDNVFGLELDPRCTQIAAFNLALAAWRRVGHCKLPEMNLACSGLAPNTPEKDWLAMAGDNDKLRRGMERLYRLFQKASVLGSLINPRAGGGDLLEAAFHELQPLLEKALAQEAKDDTAHEMAVTARGLAKAAEILAGQFTLVATNVPYLGRLKQNEMLREYCEQIYPDSKADLATCFVERCSIFCSGGGSTALVTPQNWLFLGTFQNLRETLLKTKSWNAVVQLGEEAWRSFGMRGPRTVLMVLSEMKPQASNHFFGIDVSTNRAEQPILLEEKAARLADNLPTTIKRVSQQAQFGNPDATIVFEPASGITLLSKYADSFQGSGLADIVKYRRLFWEIERCGKDWVLHQSSPDGASHFSGLHFAVYWEDGQGDLVNEPEVTIRGRNAWKKRGVACAWLGSLPTGLYLGTLYDNSAAAIIPKDPSHVAAVWCFCSSPSYLQEVRKINHKPQVANAALVKVPFDLAHWQKVAAEKYPDGLPKPFSSDPTQWLFNGYPAGSDQPLHVAVARLLGYQWPRQTDSKFPDCPALGPDGLEPFCDTDGIVCLTPLRGEAKAAERLRKLLDAAHGDAGWNERQMLAASGSSSTNLEDWLRDEFFEQHAKLFHHRPFLWHIWDGRPDGFHALVNYHQLTASDGAGHKLLETLTFAYLGDWIRRQKDDANNNVPGAESRHIAAEALQQELKNILQGEPPYDLFIRWKPLHQQPIGWHPDLNDGVRLNIRPFLYAKDVKKKDAGILRWKPNVKWTKDRGTEPQRPKTDFPWFWTWDEKTPDFQGSAKFDGNRWNDLHYTTAIKQAARAAHEKKGTEA